MTSSDTFYGMNEMKLMTACRDSILEEAKRNQVASSRITKTYLTAFDVATDSMTLKGLLTRRKGEDYRTDPGVARLGELRRALGCTGMVNGVCCLADCIPLETVKVRTQRGRPKFTREPMPTALITEQDEVEETVELITA